LASVLPFLPLIATLIAVAAAGVAVALEDRRALARPLVPLSGGLLAGLALFGLLPELSRQIGAFEGVGLAAAGCGVLMLFDRFIYPVCPSCSPKHDHAHCTTSLHGFAIPLVAAVAVHAFTDGWALIAVDGINSGARLSQVVVAAVFLHKIPEGLALGAMLRAAGLKPASAVQWSALAESSTVLGGLVGLRLTPDGLVSYPLAVAAGTFLFLGLHAIHGDWKLRGARLAMIPALAGAASAAILQWAFL
jgi:zinc transporter ZupT